MASQAFQMVMRSGPTPGKVFELNKAEIYIGRDINNDIVINDAEVSRKHARLMMQAGGYVLEDLGSTNGTFVNGQRLMGPHVLRAGELIMLGENVGLGFEAAYDADATMVAAPDYAGAPPAPREAYPPPPPQAAPDAPAQPQPAYTGQVPPSPPEVYPEEDKGSSRTLIYAGVGCLVVLLCLIVVGALAFDYFNMYCTPPFDAFFACG